MPMRPWTPGTTRRPRAASSPWPRSARRGRPSTAPRAFGSVLWHPSAPRSASWAGGSLVAALLFFWLFPVVDLSGKQEVREKDIERQNQVKRTEAVLRPMMQQELKKIGEKNPSLKKEFDQDLDPLVPDELDAQVLEQSLAMGRGPAQLGTRILMSHVRLPFVRRTSCLRRRQRCCWTWRRQEAGRASCRGTGPWP